MSIHHLPVIDKGLTKLNFPFKSEILPPFWMCLLIALLSSIIFLKIGAPLELVADDMVCLFFINSTNVQKICKK